MSLLVFVFVGCSQNTTKEDSKSTSEQSQTPPPMTGANQQGEGAMMPKVPKQIAVPESVAVSSTLTSGAYGLLRTRM